MTNPVYKLILRFLKSLITHLKLKLQKIYIICQNKNYFRIEVIIFSYQDLKYFIKIFVLTIT